MFTKEEINVFNKSVAEKISFAMQKNMEEAGLIQKGTGKNYLRDYIFRLLSYYSSLSAYDLSGNNKTALIRRKEIEIEFETYVTQPEIWDEWKNSWDIRKPLHDSGWLKNVEKEENAQYKDSEL